MAKRSSQSSRAGNKPGWQTTWLWKTIEKRAHTHGNNHANAFLPTLTQWMEKLHAIVSSGGTVPLDFTLHDAGHAFRVAERIEQLLTDSTRKNLSDYELALLLLAAYGHDVGMTPERKKVQDHHRFLFGHDTGLSAAEQQQFQQFIDDYADQPVTLPLSTSVAHLNLADELTAYYVRDRHNEWSGDWLREHMTGGTFGHLPDVTTHLIRLCQSHHWGFDRLERPDFNPFLSTGPHPQLIHLRYLACLLRLADILENDPERTPEVLFRHRSIHERQKSLVHWQKDHALSIDIQAGHIHLQARPHNARVHKALEQLADWIDHELHGIAALGERLPDHYKVGHSTIRREWLLAPALKRDIRPADGAYEYIEGAFRPNTARLLQLLSNEQLYGKPIVAVRELLQNAFDAVREKIARKRLEPHIQDPADRKWEHLLGEQEQVTLTLRPGEAHGQWHLVCEDTGVGLTKALITGHLLVSGQSRRHAILELERRCAEKEFVLGRTGQFGIGVLSYFMLAQDVQLTTTRYQGCQDSDAAHWQFSTHGVGSFGELKKLPSTPFPTGGTRVEWQLRTDRIQDPAEFAQELFDYLEATLIRIPCRFVFITEGIPSGDINWQKATGWVMTEEDWMDTTQAEWELDAKDFAPSEAYLSQEHLQRREELLASFSAGLAIARTCLRCIFHEVLLPQGAGVARLGLRYFDLPQGRSLKLFSERGEDLDFSLSAINATAWKGMACEVAEADSEDSVGLAPTGVSMEVDFGATDKAVLAVSRQTLSFERTQMVAWEQYLEAEAHAWADHVLSSGGGDYYHEVNLSRMGHPLTLREGCGWYHAGDSGTLMHLQRPLALPLFVKPLFQSLKAADGQVSSVISLANAMLPKPLMGCEVRAIFLPEPGTRPQIPCLHWPALPVSAQAAPVRFPPQWQTVLWLGGQHGEQVMNPQHPLAHFLSVEQRDELTSGNSSGFRFWEVLDQAATAPAAALALGLAAGHLILWGMQSRWHTYRQERADHLRQLWQLLATPTGLNLDELGFVFVNQDAGVLFSPEDYRFVTFDHKNPSEERSLHTLLPRITDPDWLLYADDLPAE